MSQDHNEESVEETELEAEAETEEESEDETEEDSEGGLDFSEVIDEVRGVGEIARRNGRALVQVNLKLSELIEHSLKLSSRPSTAAESSPAPSRGFEALAEALEGIDAALRALEKIPEPPEPKIHIPDPEPAPFWFWPSASKPLRPSVTLEPYCLQDELAAVREGLRVTLSRILDNLRAEGIQPIEHAGVFDPKFHRVVGTVPGDKAGEIVDVVRRGYFKMQDNVEVVLRSSLVIVVSASPERIES